MLTKSDIQKIKKVVQEVAVTKEEAKNFATKDDLKGLATKNDLSGLAKQKDLLAVKSNLEDLTEFVKDSIPPLMEWTSDIHNTIVKEKLPERVRKLEQVIKSS